MADEYFAHLPGQEYHGAPGATETYPGFDLLGYLKGLGFDPRVHESGGHKEYAVNCPECVNRGEARPDTKWRLWINAETGEYTCYNCDWAGNLPRLVQTLSKVDFHGAVRLLVGKSLDPLTQMSLNLLMPTFEPDAEEAALTLREVALPHGYVPIEGPHPYLARRGIPWEYAHDNDWGVSKAGFTANRLIVPTFMENRLVFWQARATWEGDPADDTFKKVLNPSGVSARSVLYNYDTARKFEEIVVVEGFIDAVKTGPDAVATNGKKLHEQQVAWLAATGAKSIVLMYDRDAWTDQRAGAGGVTKKASIYRAADLLKEWKSWVVKLAQLPDEHDPGSYSYQSPELREVIRRATPV